MSCLWQNFHLLSQRLVGEMDHFSRRMPLLNLDALLARDNKPIELWLADSGDRACVAPRLKPLKRRAHAAGYRCKWMELASPYA